MPNRSVLTLGALTALLLPLSSLGPTARAQPAAQTKPAAESKPAADSKPTAGEAKPAAGEPGATLSDNEKAILERIRKMKSPRWRAFGPCRYDWGSWRLSDGGVRSTGVECGDPPARESVAVHCDTLRITRRTGQEAWQPWRLPLAVGESKETGGEDMMVATLCANLKPPATTKPVQPATPPKPGAPPDPAATKPGPEAKGSASKAATKPAAKAP
jgi:hypothetical protein